MNFNDRNNLLRKSDPTYKNKKSKETAYVDSTDSTTNVKRKGASLARPGFSRQDSLVGNGRDQGNKRISVLESSKQDSCNSTGGTKLMNFIKSSLNLSKSKSKSKLNISENRQSLYNPTTSSKSEENLNGFKSEIYFPSIRSINLLLKPEDNTLYVKEYTKNNEEILKHLIVLNEECLVQPLHPSIANCQNFCFQIIKRETSLDINNPFYSNNNSVLISSIAKSVSYNSTFCSLQAEPSDKDSIHTIRCSSAAETNEWITRLKKHINPKYDKTIRHEDLFKIWIQEAKNLILKKRYYCEIKLDNILYGRTKIKTMTDMVFWGEEFEFRGLQNVNKISVLLYRMTDNKKKHEKSELIAQINVPCSDFTESSFIEKWYSPSPDIRFVNSKPLRPEFEELMKTVTDYSPVIRIKGRYRPLEILPTNYYEPLSEYLIKNSISLVESLECHLKVKSKEDFVKILLLILEHKGHHIEFLSELVSMEVSKAEDNLILRGNTIASKAMECYLKMVGEKYLTSILTELINQVVYDEIDCEVDPLRITKSKESTSIIDNQKKLLILVDKVWTKIHINAHLVPRDLKLVFTKIRDKLSASKRVSSCASPMIDQVISSCLFLRFLCPAIMSPFLFGLSSEYSDKMCINRTFTLIAKCIQSLANFSQFPQSKESYMEFMQNFINTNSSTMRSFLRQISSINFDTENYDSHTRSFIEAINRQSKPDRFIDNGYHLAELLFQLNIHLKDIPENEYTRTLREVRSVIEKISRLSAICAAEVNPKSKLSCSVNINSRIPIFNGKSDKNLMETKSKSRLSDTAHSTNPVKPKRKSSLSKKTTDVENVSHISIRPKEYKPNAKDKNNVYSNDNYVDFEHCDSLLYDDPSSDGCTSMKTSQKTKFLNEEEINGDWMKMVKECTDNSSDITSPAGEDLNYTFNSSGYQSLTKPSPDDIEKCIIQPHTRFESVQTEELNKSLPINLPVKPSFKTSQVQRQNNYKRIKKNCPPNNKPTTSSNDLNCSDNKNLQSIISQTSSSFSCSHETLESIGNLSGIENLSLSGSKSYLSLYQKKTSGSSSNLMLNSLEKHVSESRESSNCSLEYGKVLSQSSQSISNTTNLDLDPLILNEKKRIKLFLEFFNIPKPSPCHGNAIDLYKQRTTDENCLENFYKKKSKITRADINGYLPAAYRITQDVHQQSQISTSSITKFLIFANCQIQNLFVLHRNDTAISDIPKEKKEIKSLKSSKPKSPKNHRDPSILSTHSLPYPSAKYSK